MGSTGTPQGKQSGSEERDRNGRKTFHCQISPLCGCRKGQGCCPPWAQELSPFCHSQVIAGVRAALLLPPIDDDDGDGHADDEHGSDDASHDPNDPSRGTLR